MPSCVPRCVRLSVLAYMLHMPARVSGLQGGGVPLTATCTRHSDWPAMCWPFGSATRRRRRSCAARPTAKKRSGKSSRYVPAYPSAHVRVDVSVCVGACVLSPQCAYISLSHTHAVNACMGGLLQEERREARRQQRKLNFLITQTELYAHFFARKLGGDDGAPAPAPASLPPPAAAAAPAPTPVTATEAGGPAALDFDTADEATLRAAAQRQAMQGTAIPHSPKVTWAERECVCVCDWRERITSAPWARASSLATLTHMWYYSFGFPWVCVYGLVQRWNCRLARRGRLMRRRGCVALRHQWVTATPSQAPP
jgi:hypothetical protein